MGHFTLCINNMFVQYWNSSSTTIDDYCFVMEQFVQNSLRMLKLLACLPYGLLFTVLLPLNFYPLGIKHITKKHTFNINNTTQNAIHHTTDLVYLHFDTWCRVFCFLPYSNSNCTFEMVSLPKINNNLFLFIDSFTTEICI